MLSAPATLAVDGALLVALLPLGLFVLWLTEKTLGFRPKLLLTERLVLGLYTSGAVLWVVASIPLPVYGASSVSALVVVGVAGGIAVLVRDGAWPAGRRALQSLSSWTGLMVCALTVALLMVETIPVLNRSFPNAWDGSASSLWVTLILRDHTLPWTLAPYAVAGVNYPMGTSVWLTLPVMLLATSVVSSPVLLPPLFLSLSVPAAFCWGFRLAGGSSSSKSSLVGLVFAAFFGLVASWPRLEIGGSYDFALAMPLLLVLVGLVYSFAESGSRDWKPVIALGLAGGVLVTLSLAAGEALILLTISALVSSRKWGLRAAGKWFSRVLVLIAIVVAFTWRTLVAFAMWYRYPVGVLTQVGTTGYTPAPFYGTLNAGLVQGELDPFVLWKPKLSPVPVISLELQVLLILGVGMVAAASLWPRVRLMGAFPPSMARSLCWNAVVLFLATSVLVLTTLPNSVLSDLGGLSDLDEMSVLWFLSLEALAAIPVVAAVLLLDESWRARNGRSRRTVMNVPATQVPFRRGVGRIPRSIRGAALLAVVILIVPIGTGIVASATSVPAYIQSDVAKTSNVTAGDLAALVWVGSHLPSCSSVLVAPGSAGQFLPEYALVHLVYQMDPGPRNYSYHSVITDLRAGNYTNTTRSELLSIGVTEVFATGQTSVSYLPMNETVLRESPDFQLLFEDGDAEIFAFEPGIAQSSCNP